MLDHVFVSDLRKLLKLKSESDLEFVFSPDRRTELYISPLERDSKKIEEWHTRISEFLANGEIERWHAAWLAAWRKRKRYAAIAKDEEETS
jgi:hypothetical protein